MTSLQTLHFANNLKNLSLSLLSPGQSRWSSLTIFCQSVLYHKSTFSAGRGTSGKSMAMANYCLLIFSTSWHIFTHLLVHIVHRSSSGVKNSWTLTLSYERLAEGKFHLSLLSNKCLVLSSQATRQLTSGRECSHLDSKFGIHSFQWYWLAMICKSFLYISSSKMTTNLDSHSNSWHTQPHTLQHSIQISAHTWLLL
jgi:hypothetical protein